MRVCDQNKFVRGIQADLDKLEKKGIYFYNWGYCFYLMKPETEEKLFVWTWDSLTGKSYLKFTIKSLLSNE